ncbi:MAG: peptide deformylase [Clostridiales bacterium]|jgi:peptide deformylase|nr:peptide deformylase [Clostridiales bacterium]
MAIRNIANFNDPLFRKKSKEVVKFNERLWDLLDDMRDTLVHVNGYGCAAVHVGVLRRAFVVVEKSGVIEVVNPVIADMSEKTQRVQEGSIASGAPRGFVERPVKVTVTGVDRFGSAITVVGENFLAATFCHEIDHLDGILFTDKVVN